MIAESFEHKFSLEERYKNLAQLTVSNQVGIRNARNILEAELNTMVESTRFLQKEVSFSLKLLLLSILVKSLRSLNKEPIAAYVSRNHNSYKGHYFSIELLVRR